MEAEAHLAGGWVREVGGAAMCESKGGSLSLILGTVTKASHNWEGPKLAHF